MHCTSTSAGRVFGMTGKMTNAGWKKKLMPFSTNFSLPS